MIKHGKIYPLNGHHSHLDPIREFVTKGVADAKEKIVLEPRACDVRGAKRFNGQQCVIAKALTRTAKPEAVAIGRNAAFAVFDGLAIRFAVPAKSREVVEEFDEKGRVRKVPIELVPADKGNRLHKRQGVRGLRTREGMEPNRRKYVKRYGVRAVGGGVAVA
jgi:hypothetical protein